MSLIRCGYDMRYVDGVSNDYVFHCSTKDPKDEFIQDYGDLTNEGLVEILCGIIEFSGVTELSKEYLWKKLAERLNVKLRDKPLSDGEWYERVVKRCNGAAKEMGL